MQIPKWAEGPALRISMLKQDLTPPDLDTIFEVPVMPDLAVMFDNQSIRSEFRLGLVLLVR
jgi:hypothetical protein